MFAFAALILAVFGLTANGEIGCKNQNNQNVEWWFTLKLPEVVGVYRGYTYFYVDSLNSSPTLGDLHDPSNPLAQTLYQLGLYGASPVNPKSVGYVLWNDQTYSSVTGKVTDHEQDDSGVYYAHSKATIGFDANTGFWLAHSAPGFPFSHDISPSSWSFPFSQSIYTQHFFCVSVSTRTLNSVSTALQYYYAFIYDSNIPSSVSGIDDLANFATGKYKTSATTFKFQSLAGTQFIGFAKHGQTDSDMFEDYVAPGLQSNLFVESWCCGDYGDCCQPSRCRGDPIVDPSGPQSGQSTYAYSSITIEKFSFASNLYYETKDNHAKFALSESGSWVCPSDNNRADTQRQRGGGSLCFQNKPLYNFIYSHIVSFNTTC